MATPSSPTSRFLRRRRRRRPAGRVSIISHDNANPSSLPYLPSHPTLPLLRDITASQHRTCELCSRSAHVHHTHPPGFRAVGTRPDLNSPPPPIERSGLTRLLSLAQSRAGAPPTTTTTPQSCSTVRLVVLYADYVSVQVSIRWALEYSGFGACRFVICPSLHPSCQRRLFFSSNDGKRGGLGILRTRPRVISRLQVMILPLAGRLDSILCNDQNN